MIHFIQLSDCLIFPFFSRICFQNPKSLKSFWKSRWFLLRCHKYKIALYCSFCFDWLILIQSLNSVLTDSCIFWKFFISECCQLSQKRLLETNIVFRRIQNCQTSLEIKFESDIELGSLNKALLTCNMCLISRPIDGVAVKFN